MKRTIIGLGLAAGLVCTMAAKCNTEPIETPKTASETHKDVKFEATNEVPPKGWDSPPGCPSNMGTVVRKYTARITMSQGNDRVGQKALFVTRKVVYNGRTCFQQTGDIYFNATDLRRQQEKFRACTPGAQWPECIKQDTY